ncbi:MAG: glycosyltransferase [Bacteroidales bacterium]|nr:glycosyltransferase [Bacteroidales bacterium]
MTVLISLIILFVYSFLIIKFIKGWNTIPFFKAEKSELQTRVTIITPCKNEVDNLPQLFKAINEQSYRNFELIVVDDNSIDGSYEFAVRVSLYWPTLKARKSIGSGKKSAIYTGIYLSENELIITLDADSIPSSDWLRTIVLFYEKNPSDLIICPVKTGESNAFIGHFEQFEFASLVASGVGAVGAGKPILCNGANLAFRRDAWLMSESELHFDEPSGDDIFLLQSIKRRKGVIRFLKSTDAMVVTRPSRSVISFFKQRKRWVSKLSAFKDFQFAFTAISVFAICFLIVLNLVLAFVNVRFLYLSLALFVSKWIVDLMFFRTIQSFFNLKNVLTNSLLFSFIYPFYVLLTAGCAVFGRKNKKW